MMRHNQTITNTPHEMMLQPETSAQNTVRPSSTIVFNLADSFNRPMKQSNCPTDHKLHEQR